PGQESAAHGGGDIGHASARSAGPPRTEAGQPDRRRHPGVAGGRGVRHGAGRRLPEAVTGMRIPAPPAAQVEADVARALAEDIGNGDVTASLLPDTDDVAYLLCKETAVICGRPWFDACHRALDPAVRIEWRVAEGDRVEAGTVLAT